MNEFDLNQTLDHFIGTVANPALPVGLEQRLKARTFTAPDALPAGAFGSLDRAGGQQTRKTIWGAALLHAAILALLFVQVRAMHDRMAAPATIDMIELTTPPVAPAAPNAAGGGGGHAGPAPVTRGNPPQFAEQQLVPPDAKPVLQPKLAADATVVVQQDLKMAKSDIPQLGMPNSPLVGMSPGNGRGSGLGPGHGDGVGLGSNGNLGGGVKEVGGGVSAPIPLYTPEPEFSEEARKSRVSGNVMVYLQVDEHGLPTHIHIVRGIGLGLDEKAIEAVKQYRFKPAMEDGHPVAVEMTVEVNFNIM